MRTGRAGVVIDVKIDDRELKALIAGLRGRLKNLTPAMRIIGETVRSSAVKNFEAGGRPEKWAPSKKKRGKTLIRTGALMKSIAWRAYPDRVEVGTNLPQAALHQSGGLAGKRKKIKLPARPFLMVQAEDWPIIEKAVTDYLTGGDQ